MHHKYQTTLQGVMAWANSELAHVGRITGVEDPDIQYSYAMSTVNGMLHLRQAIYELVQDEAYSHHKKDLQKTHDAVVRVIKHLIKDHAIDLDAIKKFNTRGVLHGFEFLKDKPKNKKNANTNKNVKIVNITRRNK
jgi:hypothetical protein